MAITYTFTVNKIEIAPALGELADVITRVRYDYEGVDENGIKGTFAGVTPLPAPETTDIVPLTEITEEIVIGWLEAYADKPHMQERIQKQIEGQVAPKYVDIPLPWAPVEEVVEPVVPTPEV